MTNERHEKAIEAADAARARLFVTMTSNAGGSERLMDIVRIRNECMEEGIRAYLQAMDAVIVPKELAFDETLNDLGWDMNKFLHDGGAQFDGRVFNNMKAFLKTAIEKWVASSPNHFTNGE